MKNKACAGRISNKKYITIDRIFVYRYDKSLDLKYAFRFYTTLIQHIISSKNCIQKNEHVMICTLCFTWRVIFYVYMKPSKFNLDDYISIFIS